VSRELRAGRGVEDKGIVDCGHNAGQKGDAARGGYQYYFKFLVYFLNQDVIDVSALQFLLGSPILFFNLPYENCRKWIGEGWLVPLWE
jgi:hypothetical protein